MIGGCELYHVNFHTLGRRAVFEDAQYDHMLRACLPAVLERRQIVCLAWEIMPTHVHLLLAVFADYNRAAILAHIKGDTARAFFAAFLHLRDDLLGGHLWARGYQWVLVRSHRQCTETITYIRRNRERADLPPPASLQAAED
jgi:REP element-mobilizing transposase RayT